MPPQLQRWHAITISSPSLTQRRRGSRIATMRGSGEATNALAIAPARG